MDSLKCSYGLDSEESNETNLASCNSTRNTGNDHVTRDIHWMVILLSCILTHCGAILGAFANIKALREIWRKWYVRKSCKLTIQLLITSSITCCILVPMDGISKALRFFEKPSMLSCSFMQLLMHVTKYSMYVCILLIAFERQHKICLGINSVSQLSKRWLSLSFGWCILIPLFLYQAVMEYQHYQSSSVFYQLCVSQRSLTLNTDVLDFVTVMYILEPIICMMTLITSTVCYVRGMVVIRRQMHNRKRSSRKIQLPSRSVVYRDKTGQSKSPTVTISDTSDDLNAITIGLNSNNTLQPQRNSIKDQIVNKLKKVSNTSKSSRKKESVSSNTYQTTESRKDKKKELDAEEKERSPDNISVVKGWKPRKPSKARTAKIRKRRNKIQEFQSESHSYNQNQSVTNLFAINPISKSHFHNQNQSVTSLSTINPISEQPQPCMHQDETRQNDLKPIQHVNKRLGKVRQNEAEWYSFSDQSLRTWSMSSNKTTASGDSNYKAIKRHDSKLHKLNWPTQSLNHVAPLRSSSALSSTTFNSVTTEDMIQCDSSVVPMAMNKFPWDHLYSNSGTYYQHQPGSISVYNDNFQEGSHWYPQNCCNKSISDSEYQSNCTEKNHLSSAIKTWQLNEKYIRNKEHTEIEDFHSYRKFSFSSFSNSESSEEEIPGMLQRKHQETTKTLDNRLSRDESNKYRSLRNAKDLKNLNMYPSAKVSAKHRRVRSLEDFRQTLAVDDDPKDCSSVQINVTKDTADASTQMDELFYISSSQPSDILSLKNYQSSPRILVTQPGFPDQCEDMNNCRYRQPRNVLHNNWCSGFQETARNDQTPDTTVFRSTPNSCIDIQPHTTWRFLPQLQQRKKEIPFKIIMIYRSILILGVLMVSFLPESILTLMMATRLVSIDTIYIIYPLFHGLQYLHAFVCPVVYVFTNKNLMKAIRSRHSFF